MSILFNGQYSRTIVDRPAWRLIISMISVSAVIWGCLSAWTRTAAGDIKEAKMSNNTNSMSGATGDTLILFRSFGGPELGPGLHERETSLTLNGSKKSAALDKHRSDSDAENEPIGRFEMPLGVADMDRIWRLVDSVGLSNLPKSGGGQLGSSIFEIAVKKGDTSYTRQIVSSDINSVNKVGPLLDELYRLAGETQKHPQSAIRVAVIPEYNNERFQVEIINIGTNSVYIPDPRALGHGEDDENWAGVRIAPLPAEVPGQTSPPLEWSRLFLDMPPDKTAPGLIRLDAGKQISWPTHKWEPDIKKGRYLVQGVFSSYGASDTATSVVLMRGAIFSEAKEISGK
jgi:hypothetical protein